MANKKLIKIIIPIFIVVVVAVIWTMKNLNYDNNEVSETTSHNQVFALEATTVNLEKWKEYNVPIIIDFGSESCMPCLAMAPELETVNAEMQGKAIVKFVNIGKYPKAAEGFPFQFIPTQFFYDADGKPYVPSDDMKIEFEIHTDQETGEHLFTTHTGMLSAEQMKSILADMGVN